MCLAFWKISVNNQDKEGGASLRKSFKRPLLFCWYCCSLHQLLHAELLRIPFLRTVPVKASLLKPILLPVSMSRFLGTTPASIILLEKFLPPASMSRFPKMMPARVILPKMFPSPASMNRFLRATPTRVSPENYRKPVLS